MFEFEFTGQVVRSDGAAAWHFILLPPDLSEEVDHWCSANKGGWGSLRVQVTIGATSWATSIFPDTSRGTYVLPVKAEVRRAEALAAGDAVEVALVVRGAHV